MDPEKFDYQGWVVHTIHRPDLRSLQTDVQKRLNRKHGKGWEFECAVPGTLSVTEGQEREVEALILVFRKKKERLVTGVSVGGA
jgi:hypothetical protein